VTTDSSAPIEPRFCHQCAAALQPRHVEEEQRERLVCESCGFIHYVNPRVVASVLPERVHNSGRRQVLLMRRALEPRRGFWTPPGGFVELGESTEAAAVREGAEEVGLPLAVTSLLGVYNRPQVGIVVVSYRARPLGGEPKPGHEALEARWFAADEIPWDELAFETTTKALRDWVASEKT
jgi:ADP-ribose pyrophosphatase YjhB (NUDIX family)